jgi:hypothetical protein
MAEKSFLDEGFDFIEESCSEQPLEFTEASNEVIVEANGEKSAYHILGTCRGVFQPINEPSRNQRVYESTHWQTQLGKQEVQERLKRRGMWGTLGHFDRKITDADIREGLVSHIITKLEVRESADNKPYLYGELEILDTPAGRILEAMYKGGADLYVSSRGAGKLISVVGDTMKHVDPNSFYFEGFDIVRAPGFLKARPVYEAVANEAVSESEVATKVSDVENNIVEKMEETMKTLPESSIEELKGQIDQLTKIIEKVVDDVYEEEIDETSDKKVEAVLNARQDKAVRDLFSTEPTDLDNIHKLQNTEKMAKRRAEKQGKKLVQDEETGEYKHKSEAFTDFISLMADSNISEETFSEILDMIKGSI